jgi:hypothetical protein
MGKAALDALQDMEGASLKNSAMIIEHLK